jgi:hypothetical protein
MPCHRQRPTRDTVSNRSSPTAAAATIRASGRARYWTTLRGNNNTAAGANSLFDNTVGSFNTPSGPVLSSRTLRAVRIAIGFASMDANTNGSANTAAGFQALMSNHDGSSNTATGHNAMMSNTSGNKNTAAGVDALPQNKTGSDNTAAGFQALANNISGFLNTAIGQASLAANTGGSEKTATGANALQSNTTGPANTAIGAKTSRPVPPLISCFMRGGLGFREGADQLPVRRKSESCVMPSSSTRPMRVSDREKTKARSQMNAGSH